MHLVCQTEGSWVSWDRLIIVAASVVPPAELMSHSVCAMAMDWTRTRAAFVPDDTDGGACAGGVASSFVGSGFVTITTLIVEGDSWATAGAGALSSWAVAVVALVNSTIPQILGRGTQMAFDADE